MKTTIAHLIAALAKFDDSDSCYAYEGEDIGLVIVRDNQQIGFIPCKETTQ